MSAPRCHYAGHTKPRMVCTVPHDHGETCELCRPCHADHCRVCHTTHHEGTCPGCLTDIRDTLHAITTLCNHLPTEATHRGVDGEAMHLLGPTADPEALGHMGASIAAGRVPPDYLTEIHGDTHPTWVASTWAMIYRDAFDHDEPTTVVTLTDELSYLERNLTYMATWPYVPFEDLAADLRRCRTHLEAVLHDAERGVRANVPCFDCGADLERKLGKTGFEDEYTCRGCRRRYTIAEYNFALRAALETPTTPTMEESA